MVHGPSKNGISQEIKQMSNKTCAIPPKVEFVPLLTMTSFPIESAQPSHAHHVLDKAFLGSEVHSKIIAHDTQWKLHNWTSDLLKKGNLQT